MFTLSNLQTLRAQVTSDGVICLMSLYIEDEQSESRLANICGRSVKHMRTVVFPLLNLHAYAETTGIFLKITSKARDIIAKIGSTFATLLGIQASAFSADSATLNTAQAALPGLVPPASNRGKVFHALSFILDQDQNQSIDQDQESEMNERVNAENSPRDLQSISAWLDRNHVVDPINGKRKYRTLILADSWCTLERLDAAVERARLNPNRHSDNCLGLALHELTDPKHTHRADIEAMVQTLKDQATREASAKQRTEEDRARRESAADPLTEAHLAYPPDDWKVWSYIQEEIKQFNLHDRNFKLVWESIYSTSHDDTHLTLILPDSTWLNQVQRLSDTIVRMLHRDTGRDYIVEFVTI